MNRLTSLLRAPHAAYDRLRDDLRFVLFAVVMLAFLVTQSIFTMLGHLGVVFALWSLMIVWGLWRVWYLRLSNSL